MTSESRTAAPGWGPLLVISSLLSLSVVALHSSVGCGSRIWCGKTSARSCRLSLSGNPLFYSRRDEYIDENKSSTTKTIQVKLDYKKKSTKRSLHNFNSDKRPDGTCVFQGTSSIGSTAEQQLFVFFVHTRML